MKAREAAYCALMAINEGAYANIVVDEILNKYELPRLERSFCTELVYGTVKHKLTMDWIINRMVKKPDKLENGAVILLRMAFYQLLYLDRVPSSAVTNEAVKLARKYFHSGVAGLVNGVLRSYLRDPQQIKWPDSKKEPGKYLEVVYSHPSWMIKRWLKRYGFQNTLKFCEFNNSPAELWVRTNTLRCTPDKLLKLLEEEGCKVEKSSKVPEGIIIKKGPPIGSLAAFKSGYFTVQDESSMLVSHVLDPQSGKKVLDACSGPGGKATHLAQFMNNKGAIISCDVHQHRLKLIEETAKRLGIVIIKTVLQDAAKIAEQMDEDFDYILVDAPCSGLGVIRRRPDLRWRRSEADIIELVSLQREILRSVAKRLKKGGRLVYSTCTTEPEENQENINWLRTEFPEIKSYNIYESLPYRKKPEEGTEDAGMLQLLPFADQMEGFFIAGLARV